MKLFGKETPATRAAEELVDIEREEFTLRRNMTHDAHRLAYLVERRSQLTPPADPEPPQADLSNATLTQFDAGGRVLSRITRSRRAE